MKVHKNAAARRVARKPRGRSGKVETVVIDKRALAAAKRACGPNQKIVLRRDGTIDIVNK